MTETAIKANEQNSEDVNNGHITDNNDISNDECNSVNNRNIANESA